MTPHVPVVAHLALPHRYAHVMDYLALFDAELRLRVSAERPHLYVLERRVRNAPVVNTSLRDESDALIQARDGYIHVSTVHPQWLERPWKIIEELKRNGDLWELGGATKVADEIEYEERWRTITRKRRRRQLFREIALDSFDVLNRMGSERTRINNPALSHDQVIGGR